MSVLREKRSLRELRPDVAAELHNRVRAIEERLREEIPGARFDLECSAPNEYHLYVNTHAGTLDVVDPLIEDHIAALERALGVTLWVIPTEDEPEDDEE